MNYILTYLGNTHISNNEKEFSTFGNFFSGLKQGLNQIFVSAQAEKITRIIIFIIIVIAIMALVLIWTKLKAKAAGKSAGKAAAKAVAKVAKKEEERTGSTHMDLF